MNSTRFKFVLVVLAFSLVLNLGLASLLRGRRATVPTLTPAEPASETTPAAPTPRRPVSSRPRALADASGAVESFQWSSLESPDYKVYIANLRQVGCPEETIRDVIIADLNKSYLTRLNAVAARGRSVAYWKSDAGRSEELRALEKEMRVVEREKRSVIKELLGVDVPEARLDAGKLLHDELAYGFLPPDKAGQVRSLFQHYQELEREIADKADGFLTAEDRAAQRELRKKREEELATLLSPAELDEYQMRNSSTAEVLRTKTAAMALSEDDFRKMFAIRKNYEAALAQLDQEGRGGQPREALRQQRDEQIRNMLGDQRYADYQKAQDMDYRNLASIGDRYKLPSETINSAYEINRLAQEQMSQLLNDGSMDPTRRKEAIAAIRAETDQELRRTLGQQGYDSYRQRGNGITFSSGNGDMVMRTVSVGPNGESVVERRAAPVAPRPARPPTVNP